MEDFVSLTRGCCQNALLTKKSGGFRRQAIEKAVVKIKKAALLEQLFLK